MIGLRKLTALAVVIWTGFALPATAQTTLRMVPHADIKILDPIWTTALITRNFGYMVFDVLFAKDADLKIQPQMAEKTDLQSSNNLQPVAKQQLEKAGFKVDLVAYDWQTVVSRRARKEPPSQGGWNIFFTTNITLDSDNPGTNSYAAGTCEKAWFGWPCDAEMEKLRDAFLHTIDPAKQKELGNAISDRLMDQAFYAPIGQYKAFGAYRKDRLEGWLPGPVAVVWNISKKN